ncbi:MAG: thioredoxin domain-containing protein [Actinobacteria bacterium]|nr:thioredoxin domain-containing protein [Actinomycetota bacterium]
MKLRPAAGRGWAHGDHGAPRRDARSAGPGGDLVAWEVTPSLRSPVSNRLATETSPYLLQHADNPVQWYPWGEDAFHEAKEQDKPIFLSVGYSSCHWCHVMAHESFEDPDVARLMNEHFVNVKVDREERPDVDAVYMDAVTAMTGHGGWPMSVFLTPDGEPFFGGTYWPHPARQGMPGFTDILEAVHEAWTERRHEVAQQSQRLVTALRERAAQQAPRGNVDLDVTDHAASTILEQAWDRHAGGFGRAPKFPQAMTIEYLLDRHARTGGYDELLAAGQALDAMARGGIHDQIGGGFARYSTDAHWLVPHFEKMLYDNALLLPCYAKAAVSSGDDRFARVARSTADYLLRDMQHPEGGLWSATDADSEGVEGRFFVWSDEEFRGVVAEAGADADVFARFFGVTADGNWEGTNILHEPVPRDDFVTENDLDADSFRRDLEAVRETLYAHRQQRVHPGLDDKVLTSWNALAIRGLARAGVHLDVDRYTTEAVRIARFLEANLVVDGVLHHTWKDGRASVPAFLEDVSYLTAAYLDLYAATGEVGWFDRAVELADDALARFRDEDGGGFFQTAADGEELYRRPKETWDNATPSGNSVMADVSLRLAAYTGQARWREVADEVIATFQGDVARMPTGYGWLLQAVEFAVAGPREIAIVGAEGEQRNALVRAVWDALRPGTVVAVAAPDDPAAVRVPLLEGRGEADGAPAAYVCHDFVCERPVTSVDDLRSLFAP